MQRKEPALRNIGVGRNARALPKFQCNYFSGRELIYCDPPCLQSSRTSTRLYRFDYTDADHLALLLVPRSLPCQIMISSYPSDLYEQTLKDWQSIELQVKNNAGVRTEKNSGSTLSPPRPFNPPYR